MRKVLLLAALAVIAAMAGGCATHISGLQDKAGAQTLYVFGDEHTAFAAAYGAIVAVLPNTPVKAVSGPMRGYSVNDGDAVFDVRILPGVGRNITDGTRVSGYYVETSLQKESIIDHITIQKIHRAIVEVFAVVGQAVQVDGIRLGKYKSAAFLREAGEDGDENDDLLVSGFIADELSAGRRPVEKVEEAAGTMPPEEKAGPEIAAEKVGESVAVVEALNKLNQLRRDEGLTWEEYSALKARIIRE